MRGNQARADTGPSQTALYFQSLVDSSQYTQKEIAAMLGYTKPNIITMFKQGLTKLPIDRIPKIAKIFGIDGPDLLKTAMTEYEPQKYKAIIEILGDPVPEWERNILQVIREEVTKEELSLNNLHYRGLIRECLARDKCLGQNKMS